MNWLLPVQNSVVIGAQMANLPKAAPYVGSKTVRSVQIQAGQ